MLIDHKPYWFTLFPVALTMMMVV